MVSLKELIDNYQSSNIDIRKERKKKTQEIFTPYSIVKKMCDKIDNETWSDPTKTFLEPSCGDGNFIMGILWNRIQHGIDWKTAVETLFAVDLMEDNIKESKQRVIKMFDEMGIEYNLTTLKEILDKNVVCSDFFKWNFEEWRPYTEEELKKLKIK